MQVVVVSLEWFWRNSLLKCVSQPKMAKNSLKPPILGGGGSRSFKVIDVGTTCCTKLPFSGTKLPHKKLETLGYHMVKTRSLYLTWP